MTGYIELLRKNPDFARLWLAQVISLFGDWFGTVVLAALVVEYSKDSELSGLAVSAFLLARLVPPLLFAPFAGVLVDRFDRKKLLIFSDVARTAVFLLMLFVSGPETLWLLYVLVVIQFLLSAIFDPGRNAILPGVLERREDLVPANTLGGVTWSVMLAVGAIVGGVTASLFGAIPALVFDALTYLLSALLIMGIRVREVEAIPETTPQSETESDNLTFWEGVRYLARNPSVLAVTFVKAGQGIGSIDAIIIAYGTTLFVLGENGTWSLSILWSAFGIGAVIGPLILNRINDGSVRHMRRLIRLSFVMVVLGWLVFSGAQTLFVVALAAVLRAMGGSVNWVYSSAIIQIETDYTYLGRVFAIDMALFQLANSASIIFIGLLMDVWDVDVRIVVLFLALLSVVPLVIWAWATRWLERRETIPEAAPVLVAGD